MNKNWMRGPDLNRRPSGYGPDELPLIHPAGKPSSGDLFVFPPINIGTQLMPGNTGNPLNNKNTRDRHSMPLRYCGAADLQAARQGRRAPCCINRFL